MSRTRPVPPFSIHACLMLGYKIVTDRCILYPIYISGQWTDLIIGGEEATRFSVRRGRVLCRFAPTSAKAESNEKRGGITAGTGSDEEHLFEWCWRVRTPAATSLRCIADIEEEKARDRHERWGVVQNWKMWVCCLFPYVSWREDVRREVGYFAPGKPVYLNSSRWIYLCEWTYLFVFAAVLIYIFVVSVQNIYKL